MTHTRPPRGFDAKDLVPPPLPAGPFPVSALALDVAGACNLSCRYCAEAATQPRRRPMPAATLEAAWRLLFPDGRPRQGQSIRLGSGEPLRAFPLLRKLAEMIDQAGGSAAEGRPAVFLTTNGTLAGPEIRDWLVASGWHVKVSLDGPQPIHDRWRVTPSGTGTFEPVSAVVADLARRMPERLSVTAVLCRGADPEQVFEAIAGLGVRRIELVPVAHQDPAVLPDQQDVEGYERFLQRYVRRFRNEPAIPMLVRFQNCVQRAMGYDLRSVPCGAGRSFFGVGPDGEIYPCFRFIGVEGYRLGRLPDGLDTKATAAFEKGAGRPYLERTPCQRCWASPLCGGPCFAISEMFGQLDIHCAYTRADARVAVRMVNDLAQRDPERLLPFLPAPLKALVP